MSTQFSALRFWLPNAPGMSWRWTEILHKNINKIGGSKTDSNGTTMGEEIETKKCSQLEVHFGSSFRSFRAMLSVSQLTLHTVWTLGTFLRRREMSYISER